MLRHSCLHHRLDDTLTFWCTQLWKLIIYKNSQGIFPHFFFSNQKEGNRKIRENSKKREPHDITSTNLNSELQVFISSYQLTAQIFEHFHTFKSTVIHSSLPEIWIKLEFFWDLWNILETSFCKWKYLYLNLNK